MLHHKLRLEQYACGFVKKFASLKKKKKKDFENIVLINTFFKILKSWVSLFIYLFPSQYS